MGESYRQKIDIGINTDWLVYNKESTFTLLFHIRKEIMMRVDIYKAKNINDGYLIVPTGTDITSIKTDINIEVFSKKHKENHNIPDGEHGVTGSNGKILDDIKHKGYSIQNAGIFSSEKE